MTAADFAGAPAFARLRRPATLILFTLAVLAATRLVDAAAAGCLRGETRTRGPMIPVVRRAVLAVAVPILLFASTVALPARADAQTVADPKFVQFAPSADHNAVLPDGRATVDHYTLSIWQPSAAQPFEVVDIGKPTPGADGTIVYDFSSTVSTWPLPGGTYVATVDAVGPGGDAASVFSNPFYFSCTYALSAISASFGSAAASGTVGVSTQAGCAWSASSNASWIAVSTASRNGPGTATYTVAANTGTASRIGTLTIAGITYSVTQAASSTCNYALSSASQAFPAGGGSGSVGVTSPAGCAWTASANVVWLAVTTSGGVGNGTAAYTVSANTGSTSRTATLTIAGLAYTVTQAAGAGSIALPSPWSNQDIGAVGLAGSASYSSGVFTVKGAGADIWGTADAFQYVYQTLPGDGQVVARVTGLTNTNSNAKAGVMLRQALTTGSADLILDVEPGGVIEFMSRTNSGASTTFLAGGTQAPPAWLKLVRSGSTVTASISADGTAWRTVGTSTVSMAGTLYAGLAVTSHTTSAVNTATFDNVAVTAVATTALPSPWAHRDIGSVGLAGSASYSAGVFTVQGAGADIWGTADSFHYVYQPLNSNSQIVARVTRITNTRTNAKAGVMLRESLSAGSANVILDLMPNGAIEFMSRAATGASTVYLSGATQAPPTWLRLARSGSTITASVSSDGVTWRTVGTTTTSMATSVYVGLAVTSHTTSALNTSTFDNVVVR